MRKFVAMTWNFNFFFLQNFYKANIAMTYFYKNLRHNVIRLVVSELMNKRTYTMGAVNYVNCYVKCEGSDINARVHLKLNSKYGYVLQYS